MTEGQYQIPNNTDFPIKKCPLIFNSHQRFPWALQLKEQILKEQITDDRVFFKMPFRPCPSGCGRFLSADDGHDRCLQCLGRRHAEAAFVDDSCVCCGRMSMISLRSRLSFMKGLAPSAATRADLSGSSRGSPADALGDLRVTVRDSPPGTPPRTSYSSRREHPVRFPGDFAGLSHGAPSISFGRRSGPDAGNPEMLEFALSQETARTAPLLPPVKGREENLLFRFVSVPPLVQGPAVPTFSK